MCRAQDNMGGSSPMSMRYFKTDNRRFKPDKTCIPRVTLEITTSRGGGLGDEGGQPGQAEVSLECNRRLTGKQERHSGSEGNKNS